MTSRIDLKHGLRLLAVISLLTFAHNGMAREFAYVGEGGGGVPPAEAVGGGVVPVGNGSGVPPVSTAPIWTATSSVPQLSTDTYCNNNPCLKVPGPPYRPRLDVEYSGSITEAVVDEIASYVIQDGAEKVILKVAPKIFVKVLLKAVPVVGELLGLPEAGGDLPPDLFRQMNAKSIDRQNRIDFFNNLQKTNIEQKEKAKAEAEKQQFEAAKQQYAAQQENQGLQELVGTYLSGMAQYKQMKQQSTTASSPTQNDSGGSIIGSVFDQNGKCIGSPSDCQAIIGGSVGPSNPQTKACPNGGNLVNGQCRFGVVQ